MRLTQKITLIAMTVALGYVVVFVFGLLPGMNFISAILAGILLIFLRDIAGTGCAYAAYGVTCLMLLLFLPRKLPAAAYAAILGYYPILFVDLLRIKNAVLRMIVKVLLFEGVAAGAFLAVGFFGGVHPPEQIRQYGISGTVFIVAVLIVYQVMAAAYEGFLWAYYKYFNQMITERLRAAVRLRK